MTINYSREEMVTAILAYCGEETDNKEDILYLAITKDYDLYKYIENVCEHLDISMGKFMKKYYNYESYSSVHFKAQ